MKDIIKLTIIAVITILSNHAFSQLAVGAGDDIDLEIQNAYEVESITINAKINDQIADVIVSQEVYNPNPRSLQVEIFFPLPAKSAIQNFVFMVDGKEYPGELLTKEEAVRIYEGIVSRKQDPALMEYVGYGLFKTRIFPIGPRQKRTISIQYTEVLPKNNGLIEFRYPLGTQKFSATALKNVKVKLNIKSSIDLKNIYSPTDKVDIKNDDDRNAYVSFVLENQKPKHDFRLIFSQDEDQIGTNIISYKPVENQDGYFMLLASPSIEKTKQEDLPKNIIFVLDVSGSMAGKKIEQSKEAIKNVLSNLNDYDCFNIIAYENRVNTYESQLIEYNKENFDDAISYVENLTAGGGTNINDALQSALTMTNKDDRPTYIIFLTDGLPTIGTTNEMEISQNCKKTNSDKTRIFTFGVGFDVNTRLLDRISEENGGTTTYVKPNDNLEEYIADLYNNISSPVLTDIEIAINNIRISDTYPSNIPDIFKGQQLVWTGKYNKPGKTKVTITGKVNGVVQTFSYDVEFADHKAGPNNSYVEKIWATRKVGFLIDQIDLNGKTDELIDELVALSKKYGILTPYTAFLAREDMDIADANTMRWEAERNLVILEDEVSGESAVRQRGAKNKLKANTFATYDVSEEDSYVDKEMTSNVNNIGSRTFYNRSGNWVESTITEEEEKNAITIKPYSEEYFELARSNSLEFNQCLAVRSNMIIRGSNKVYKIIY
jgi:Ca-activated chloride channel family protein